MFPDYLGSMSNQGTLRTFKACWRNEGAEESGEWTFKAPHFVLALSKARRIVSEDDDASLEAILELDSEGKVVATYSGPALR